MPESTAARAAVDANLIVIRQGVSLLARLGAERYRQRIPLCFDASIGGHMRHIIEHYQSFLSGVEHGCLDYEHRARDPGIEHEAVRAALALHAIADQLQQAASGPSERPLAYQPETAPSTPARTSILRELEFLLSHTVHHYALIAVMCRMLGVEPEETFGIAPSTLRYRQNMPDDSAVVTAVVVSGR